MPIIFTNFMSITSNKANIINTNKYLINLIKYILKGISGGHFQGQGPPQSIPVSPWFCMPSVQVGQGLQGPPQSIRISQASSCQFFTLSKQLGISTYSQVLNSSGL